MVWGRRPIFTLPTPQRPPTPHLPNHHHHRRHHQHALIKCEREMGAFPSRRNHLPPSLCCDSSRHQGPVVVPPGGKREWGGGVGGARWLASSLFLTFNRVTTNAACARRAARCESWHPAGAPPFRDGKKLKNKISRSTR